MNILLWIAILALLILAVRLLLRRPFSDQDRGRQKRHGEIVPGRTQMSYPAKPVKPWKPVERPSAPELPSGERESFPRPAPERRKTPAIRRIISSPEELRRAFIASIIFRRKH